MEADGDDGAGAARITVRRPLTPLMRILLEELVSRSVLGILPAPGLEEIAAWVKTDGHPEWAKAPAGLLGMCVEALHRCGDLERFAAPDGAEFWVAAIDPGPGVPAMEVACLPDGPAGGAVVPLGLAGRGSGRRLSSGAGGAVVPLVRRRCAGLGAAG